MGVFQTNREKQAHMLLAGLLHRADEPLLDQPHRLAAVREFLGYPTDYELREIIRTGRPKVSGNVGPLELAKAFHDEYERLAPQFGYETRPETRKFYEESANGKLMIAVCERLLARLRE